MKKTMIKDGDDMSNYTVKYNELSARDFIYLWESVWGEAPSIEQVSLAMDNTSFRISIYDKDKLIGMARLIGDKGLDYYIKDVVVIPEYQHKKIGSMIIKELLKFINDNGIQNTKIFVELCAMPDVIPFYEKFGFDYNEAQRLKMMYNIKK